METQNISSINSSHNESQGFNFSMFDIDMMNDFCLKLGSTYEAFENGNHRASVIGGDHNWV